GPRIEPPLRIQVEYGAEVDDFSLLKGEVEENLKNKLIFSPAVELVPAGTLPRFEKKWISTFK
ncbi:MAG: phenylacetate--CoA ligase family protein, partial [Candidatus Binatia bacterium]|nr:phenylacetate--CoA ligase family protein [Candidatus Binatia bacterium]